MSIIDYNILDTQLKKALECYGVFLNNLRLESKIAACGIYCNGEFSYISPTAGFEQNNIAFEWSPPNWELHTSGQDCFQLVEEELLKGWDEKYMDYTIETEKVIEIYTSALKNFRTEFFYGSDTVVGLFLGEMNTNLIKEIIVKVNPNEAVKKFPLVSL